VPVNPVAFEVKSEELEGGIRAFRVQGELDMHTAPELERRLEGVIEADAASVLLDLSACEFIDSTGIALIVRSWQKLDRDAAGEGSGRLVITCDNHQVRRLLEITGVDSSISMHQERDAALADLRG
jgi:anti-sigma B factor antagonist